MRTILGALILVALTGSALASGWHLPCAVSAGGAIADRITTHVALANNPNAKEMASIPDPWRALLKVGVIGGGCYAAAKTGHWLPKGALYFSGVWWGSRAVLNSRWVF